MTAPKPSAADVERARRYSASHADPELLATEFASVRAEGAASVLTKASAVVLHETYEAGRAHGRRDGLDTAAKECDDEALRRNDNRRHDNPRAAFQAAACRCAWRIRALLTPPPTPEPACACTWGRVEHRDRPSSIVLDRRDPACPIHGLPVRQTSKPEPQAVCATCKGAARFHWPYACPGCAGSGVKGA
jgi:hypothetical protein